MPTILTTLQIISFCIGALDTLVRGDTLKRIDTAVCILARSLRDWISRLPYTVPGWIFWPCFCASFLIVGPAVLFLSAAALITFISIFEGGFRETVRFWMRAFSNDIGPFKYSIAIFSLSIMYLVFTHFILRCPKGPRAAIAFTITGITTIIKWYQA